MTDASPQPNKESPMTAKTKLAATLDDQQAEIPDIIKYTEAALERCGACKQPSGHAIMCPIGLGIGGHR